MLSLYIIILILAGLYIIKSSNGCRESDLMNRESNKVFRGILALLIVFAHVSHEYNFPFSTEGKPYGMVVVGLFFFFSGYGIIKQYEVKTTAYIKGFLWKRIKKLFPSFIIILCIASILSLIIDIELLELGGGKVGFILLPNSWYVYVLLYYYGIFFLAAKNLRDSKKIIITLFVSTILLIIFTTTLGLGDWWWRSSFAFNVGNVVALIEYKFGNDVNQLTGKTCVVLLLGFLTICVLPNMFGFGFQKVRTLLMIALTIILPIFLYVIFQKVEIKNKKFFLILGSISYEIYLLHGVILTLIHNILPNTSALVCITLVYLVTIVTAYPISKLSQHIK